MDLIFSMKANYNDYQFEPQTVGFEACRCDSASSDCKIDAAALWGGDDNGSTGTFTWIGTGTGTSNSSDYMDVPLYDSSNENAHHFKSGTLYQGGYLSLAWMEYVRIKVTSSTDTIGIRNVSMITKAKGTAIEYHDTYETTFNDVDITKTSIKHKKAKWYDDELRGVNGSNGANVPYADDFDDDNPMTALANGTLVQSTHAYVDTIYMVKGTSILFTVPTVSTSNPANNSTTANWYRWFNYLNDSILRAGNKYDEIPHDLLYNADATAWRFANGYVTGRLNASSDYSGKELTQINFYYPTDEEFANIKDSLGVESNTYYAIACDMSAYDDFTTKPYIPGKNAESNIYNDDYIAFGADNGYCEPTLMYRAIYYIVGIDSNFATNNDVPAEFSHYKALLSEEAYHGGGNGDGKKYLDEFEITFPSRHTSAYTPELVTLTKDARAYGIPGEGTPGNVTVTLASDTTSTDISSQMSLFSRSGSNVFSYSQVSSLSLSGTTRVINFCKTEEGTSKVWKVDNGSTLTILVTKTVNSTTYNLARYKLTFRDQSIPLTEAQVWALDDENVDKDSLWWKDMTYRSKSYLENSCHLLTSLDFDYGGHNMNVDGDNNVSGADDLNTWQIYEKMDSTGTSWPGCAYTYPFPLKWNSCGYAFYDGSYDVCPWSVTDGTTTLYRKDGTSMQPQMYYMMEWGWYEICNYYIGCDDYFYKSADGYYRCEPTCQNVKNHEGCWLFVDATDKPGMLGELTFDNNLCDGSEIMVTAWLKSANSGTRWSSVSTDDAALLFTVMGIDEDGNSTPIYRECTGQVRYTSKISDTFDDEKDLPDSITGKGDEQNNWYQTYFSFVNEGAHYKSYSVRIDNYCNSTSGGDFYLDEIRVWVAEPAIDVKQVEASCSDDGNTPVKVSVGYQMLMSRMGYDTSSYSYSEGDEAPADSAAVDFIILNEYKYNEYLKSNPDDVTGAIKASILKVDLKDDSEEDGSSSEDGSDDNSSSDNGNGTENDDETSFASSFPTYYPTLNFRLAYAANNEYSAKTVNIPADGYLFYEPDSISGEIYLSADLYADIVAYTPYLIILGPHDTSYETMSEDEKMQVFADLLDCGCGVEQEFYVTATTTLRINGELADPTVTICAGETVHISPTGGYTDEDGNTGAITNEYFDWFVGTQDEFLALYAVSVLDTSKTQSTDSISVKDALLDFRELYNTVDALDAYSVYETGSNESGTLFTQAEYNLIKHFVEADSLVLYKQFYDAVASETGIQLVVQPIKPSAASSDDEDSEDESETTYISTACYGYVPLLMEVSGTAPTVNVGFCDVNYPENYTPGLRMGLSQLLSAVEGSPITISLRNATFAANVEEEEEDDDNVEESGGAKMFFNAKVKRRAEGEGEGEGEEEGGEVETVQPDHLGKIAYDEDTDEVDYGRLYLVDSNDPDYASVNGEFVQYQIPVGYIAAFQAKEGDDENAYMQIYFDDLTGDSEEDLENISEDDSSDEDAAADFKFTPKEGYYYTVNAHFEEQDSLGNSLATGCYGTIPIEIKVVPEYLVWHGTSRVNNWNDDALWRRATQAELRAIESSDYTDLTTYDDYEDYNYDYGYVPTVYSKVLIPDSCALELYPAGFSEEDSTYDWEESKPDAITDNPTDYIMYDMVVHTDETASSEGEESNAKGNVRRKAEGDTETETSYSTGRFRVNMCDEIHVGLGAYLLHPELLLYNKAWVEIGIPNATWTLAAQPFTGGVSGDWYGNNDDTPVFNDIIFDDGYNRYDPLVYQRGWGEQNAVVINDSIAAAPSYGTTGWSEAYNDAAADYGPGKGFSIEAYKAEKSSVNIDGTYYNKYAYSETDSSTVVFRMPKADTSYSYYDGTSSSDTTMVDRSNADKLWVSGLVTREDADATDVSGEAEVEYVDPITVKLAPSTDGYVLIGNPFTAPMSMKTFMEANADSISGYWIESPDGIITGTKEEMSDGTKDYLLEPYRAFFAKVSSDYLESGSKEGQPVSVKFTHEMQMLELPSEAEADVTSLSIRARSSSGTTTASVAYSDAASDDYSSGEDMLLLSGTSTGTSAPMVYTVAGDMAVSINRLSSQRVIPLGVFADDDCEYSLTFAGTSTLGAPILYDALSDTATPLDDDYSLSLTGSTHGQYFIITAEPEATGITDLDTAAGITAYSPGPRTVTVSSDAALQTVEVYSVGGMLQKRVSPSAARTASSAQAVTIDGVDSGTAIVKALTADGMFVRKILVK